VLGGSLRHQQTAHLINDVELDNLVRDLLRSVPEPQLLSLAADRMADDRMADRWADRSFVDQSFSGHSSDRSSADRSLADRSRMSSLAQRSQLRVANAAHPVSGFRAVALGEEIEIHPAELDLEPAISAITERAQHLTGATGAAIALRAGDEIVCRARAGRTAPDLGVRLQTDAGISAEAVRSGEIMLCHDAERNPRVDLASCRRLGVRSILVSPLRHYRRTLGVFEVLSSSPGAFDQSDVATMQLLSSLMVAAISRISSLHHAQLVRRAS
jgi:putative methionine-R-sulfoxide reductase with GAF domain